MYSRQGSESASQPMTLRGDQRRMIQLPYKLLYNSSLKALAIPALWHQDQSHREIHQRDTSYRYIIQIHHTDTDIREIHQIIQITHIITAYRFTDHRYSVSTYSHIPYTVTIQSLYSTWLRTLYPVLFPLHFLCMSFYSSLFLFQYLILFFFLSASSPFPLLSLFSSVSSSISSSFC